jgi:hypothetical protein
LQTSWGSSVNANRAVGQVNLAAATNNYWQVTGVQLEVGSTATEFEFLPAQVELALCQRYYYRITGNSGSGYPSLIPSAVSQTNTNVLASIQHPVTMRETPSSLDYSTIGYQRWDGTIYAVSAVSIDTGTDNNYGLMANFTVSGPGASTAGRILGNNSTTAFIAVNAEL